MMVMMMMMMILRRIPNKVQAEMCSSNDKRAVAFHTWCLPWLENDRSVRNMN